MGGIFKSLLIFTQSPYWFIRVYFYLFLIAPLLNNYLESTSQCNKSYLLCALAFISVFMAVMGDKSVYDGKNVVLFMFLYTLGDILRTKQDSVNKVNMKILFVVWLIVNIIIVTAWVILGESATGKVIWHLSFMYSHPILIANATLLFMIFSKLRIESRTINYLAGSVFAIYILTECSLVKVRLLEPVLSEIYTMGEYNPVAIFCCLIMFVIMVMMACIAIDKVFSPLFTIYIGKLEKINIHLR